MTFHGTFHGWGDPGSTCVPSKPCAVSLLAQGLLWVHTHSVITGSTSKSGVAPTCLHQSPLICGLLTLFDSFFLSRNERVFSDILLGEVSLLAMVNSSFVQTSAYSISIEQLNFCRFLNLELWSEWCNCEGEAEGPTTKETSHTFAFVTELWWFFLISNFVRVKCLLNSVRVRFGACKCRVLLLVPHQHAENLEKRVKGLKFLFVFLRQNTSRSASMRSSRS